MSLHPARGIAIDVVDARQERRAAWHHIPRSLGPAAAAVRLGEIEMTSIRRAVRDILARIGAGTRDVRRIPRLNVIDHGSCHGIEMGDDDATIETLPARATECATPTPHFAPGAMVLREHCEIGQHQRPVAALARIVAVPVFAGTGSHTPISSHDPIFRTNDGAPGRPIEDHIRANPDGTIVANAGRPEVVDLGDISMPVPLFGAMRIDR